MKLEFVCAPACRPPAGTQTALRALAARLAPGPYVVHVVVARDGLLRRLNRAYRGRSRTTDVLSFSYAAARAERGGSRRNGAARTSGPGGAGGGPDAEIYVSLDRAIAQARAQGHSRAREFVRLVLHGLLHLQGHDHHTGPEARRMRAAETRCLAWLAGQWPRLATTGLVPPARPHVRNPGR